MKYKCKIVFQIISLIIITWELESQLHKSLEIGDTVPALSFNTLQKTNSKSSLADYKGKFIILDFWNTYCLSCIESMPKLDSLQLKFDNSLQFLMITEQSRDVISRFLEKRKQVMNLHSNIPVVCDDTILAKLFVHEHVPHYVWIDDNGIIKYVTDSQEVNEANVRAVLDNLVIHPVIKKDIYTQVSTVQPLFINQNGGNGEQLLYYSIVAKMVEGIPSVSGIFNNREGDKSFAIGFSQSIRSLFQIAFNDFINQWYVPNNRTILQVDDSSKYVIIIGKELHNENYYNYQLITPARSPAQMHAMMQADLSRYFNLTACMQKRKTKCLVLKAADTSLLHSSGRTKIDFWDLSQYKATMQNVSDYDVQRRFIYNFFEDSPYPFIDETNYKGKFDLILDDIRQNDISSFNRALAKYKMELTVVDRDIDMLVIAENKTPGESTAVKLKN